MKNKLSKNMLYTIKANVFPVQLDSKFGKTVHTTVLANNKEDAIKQGERKFKNLCTVLEKNLCTVLGKNHNNNFNFTDLTIE